MQDPNEEGSDLHVDDTTLPVIGKHVIKTSDDVTGSRGINYLVDVGFLLNGSVRCAFGRVDRHVLFITRTLSSKTTCTLHVNPKLTHGHFLP